MQDLFLDSEVEPITPKKKRRTTKKNDKAESVEAVVVGDDFEYSSPTFTPAELLTLDSEIGKEVAVAVDESNSVVIYQKYISITSALNINAQRLLRTVIGLIEDGDKPGKAYTFTVSDFAKLYGINSNPSKQIMMAGKELGKRFIVPDPDDATKQDGVVIGWIDYLRVRSGIVTVKFQPAMLSVYQSFKTFSYSLGNTKDFSVAYTFSIYEKFITMLGNDTKVTFYMTLPEIWEFLKLEGKYMCTNGAYDYSNFKRRILTKVFADINGNDIDDNPCNVNFTYTERKIRKKVIGIEFNVWRVFTSRVDVKVKNPFYESLRPDTKAYFDAAVEAGVDPIEVERCISNYSEETFGHIMEYNMTANKNKGVAYWSACIRNGWTDNKSQGRFSFGEIEKNVLFSKEVTATFKTFILSLDKSQQEVVFSFVSKNLQRSKPQIYEFMRKSSLETMLNNNGFMLFVYEEVSEMVNKHEPEVIYGWYMDHVMKLNRRSSLSSSVGGQDIVDAEILSLDISGRDAIVSRLKDENIYDESTLRELLMYDDDYISDNIEYCIRNYREKRNQKDISGAIITACKNDYARNKKKKAKLEEKRKSEIKRQEEAMLLQKARDFVDIKDELPDLELDKLHDTVEKTEPLFGEIEKELEVRKQQKEKEQLKKCFFELSVEEQEAIMDLACAESSFFKMWVDKKTPMEMWESPLFSKNLTKVTSAYLEDKDK